MLVGAPASNSTSTTSRVPLEAAACRGVPRGPCDDRRAPSPRYVFTWVMAPLAAAAYRRPSNFTWRAASERRMRRMVGRIETKGQVGRKCIGLYIHLALYFLEPGITPGNKCNNNSSKCMLEAQCIYSCYNP